MIQFHVKASIAYVSLCTVFNANMQSDVVMKSLKHAFSQLKHEKHNMPHLKKSIFFPPISFICILSTKGCGEFGCLRLCCVSIVIVTA